MKTYQFIWVGKMLASIVGVAVGASVSTLYWIAGSNTKDAFLLAASVVVALVTVVGLAAVWRDKSHRGPSR